MFFNSSPGHLEILVRIRFNTFPIKVQVRIAKGWLNVINHCLLFKYIIIMWYIFHCCSVSVILYPCHPHNVLVFHIYVLFDLAISFKLVLLYTEMLVITQKRSAQNDMYRYLHRLQSFLMLLYETALYRCDQAINR